MDNWYATRQLMLYLEQVTQGLQLSPQSESAVTAAAGAQPPQRAKTSAQLILMRGMKYHFYLW